jgi:hypothetical protein
MGGDLVHSPLALIGRPCPYAIPLSGWLATAEPRMIGPAVETRAFGGCTYASTVEGSRIPDPST